MQGIKKLDRFIIKSYSLLFLGTFFICLFIFMMQFLWRYVDELVGKGLAMSVLAEFFFYSAVTLIPISLPLAILLASLITFGNFGERYELLAMKAAGISLLRIMAPLIVFVALLGLTSFYFQNETVPKAQAKLYTLIFSMKQKSPELDIPEGVFYDEIEGYNLYVKRKDRKTGWLYDVMIYNFSNGFENANIIVADSGRLEMTADKKFLYLHLYSGEQFENLQSQNTNSKNVPYRRESFDEKHSLIEFDAEFNMIDGGFMTNQSVSKNIKQLEESVDSLATRIDSIGRSYYEQSKHNYSLEKVSYDDSTKLVNSQAKFINVDSLYRAATLAQKKKVLGNATSRSENVGSDWTYRSYNVSETDKSIRLHQYEWHRKFTLSLACLIFFFIGAPLGAIIRKGGLGMPVVASVLIFIIYYIIDNASSKMARSGNSEMWMGMWFSTMILTPIGVFLTYKSNKDSVVLNADAYISWFKRVVGIRDVRHIVKKEVIIEDPQYPKIEIELRGLTNKCEEYLQTHKLRLAPNYIKIWRKSSKDEAITQINEKLEKIVEELGNSKDGKILNSVNKYPILAEYAHKSPFKMEVLNFLAAIILPVGLLFYFRIWIFRIRLQKDLEQIIATNRDLENIIRNDIL